MKRIIPWLAHLLPMDPDKLGNEVYREKSYGYFKRTLFGIMVAISMVPVTITAGLGYFQYRDLLHAEEYDQLHWRLDGAQQTVEAFVENLQSIVRFIAAEDRYFALLDEKALKIVFNRLKEQYGDFVDLGVIDSSGVQRSYSGPYDLEGKNYKSQEWFTEVMTKTVYISNVYLGYRQIPHFVIAVRKKIPDTNDYWVLRATINADTLQKIVSTIKTKATYDMFIINSEGQLQTASSSYGPVLSTYAFAPDAPSIHTEGLNTATLRASAPLKNTPAWTLVLAEQDYVHKEEWTSFKQRLLFIFLGCSITVFLVITQLVNILTTRIRESEEKRHNLLAEAEHSNKLASIGRLAAGVAHEINNPLAIINQKSGLIGDYLEFTPSFQYRDNILKSLTVINDSVLRCKNITHRLLGFARRTDAVVEEIDLNRLVGDVILFLENESLHNRIRIRTNLEGGLPPVQSDRTQLQQIFLNIINNAIDAIVHDGSIEISSASHNDGVEIKIKDDGPGMSPEVLEHIFEPFFTTKELGKGTGLGLSITYGLIKKLGGMIAVESAVGSGTVFTIHIPFTSIDIEEQHHE